VRLHESGWTPQRCELFGQYDLIVDGADNFGTRYLVNDAAVLARKPYVWGSSTDSRARSRCSGGRPRRAGPQLPHLYPEPPHPGWCRPAPKAGAGHRLRFDRVGDGHRAIKLITGLGETLLGRLMIYDALQMTYRTIGIRKDPARRRSPNSLTTRTSAA